MLDAGLPRLPPVDDFVQCMKDLNEDKASGVGEDLFDGVFEKEFDAKGQPRGTKSVQKTAVKFVFNFDALRALKGIQLADLDSWFEQFAKFVIDVRTITPDEAQQKKILEKRVESFGDPKQLRSISQKSMRTCANGLAVIYNQSGRASKITLS